MRDLNGAALPDPRQLRFRPFKHGGARPGAGRKPVDRKSILLRLSPRLIASLRAAAKAERKSVSAVAEERLSLTR